VQPPAANAEEVESLKAEMEKMKQEQRRKDQDNAKLLSKLLERLERMESQTVATAKKKRS
jgi:hypothetical protein